MIIQFLLYPKDLCLQRRRFTGSRHNMRHLLAFLYSKRGLQACLATPLWMMTFMSRQKFQKSPY
jgi:hypothetical protein